MNNVSIRKEFFVYLVCFFIAVLALMFSIFHKQYVLLCAILCVGFFSLEFRYIATADIEITVTGKVKINFLFSSKSINLSKFEIWSMSKPGQGVFYCHTNFGNYMINYTRQNYSVIKQIIMICRKSNVSVKQFDDYVKKSWQWLD